MQEEIEMLKERLKTYECGDERYAVDMKRLRELEDQTIE